jgi:hypothetical protein
VRINSGDVIWIENSDTKIFDRFYEEGWTDGLPIIPPTLELVKEMEAAVNLSPDQVVGVLAPKNAEATVRTLAVNAVMAGCLPSYFQVLITAIQVASSAEYALFDMNSTTNPAVPMLIVNGPIRNTIGLNCSYSVLGPGVRANATIGRAFSLCMINIAGRIAGEVCKSTHQHPGAYTMCIGEFEEKSPWEPLHAERGFRREESTVTVIATTGTTNMLANDCETAKELLTVFTGSTGIVGNYNLYPNYGKGQMVFLVCPDHATVMARDFTKEQVKEYLFNNTVKIPTSWLPEVRLQAIRAGVPQQIVENRLRLAETADEFVIVVAGGLGGYYSQFIPSAGKAYTRAITCGLD